MSERIIEDYVWQPPKNETHEHFLLKNIARIYLVEKGCYYVGTELYIDGLDDEHSRKRYIDCTGVDKKQTITYGIEAKVSRADYKSGYCSRCNYTYIICPKDMVAVDELPNYVGLIYVDIVNFRFIPNAKEKRLQGVELVKKAKYHINEYYRLWENGVKTEYYDEDLMFARAQKLVEQINRSNVNELIYHSNNVPMAKVVKGRRRYK